MTLKVFSTDEVLVLTYRPRDGVRWIEEAFANDETVNIKRTFQMGLEHVVPGPDGADEDVTNDPDSPCEVSFCLAELDRTGYWHFDAQVMGIDYQLLIHHEVKLTPRSFVAERNVAVFKTIGELGLDRLVVGGQHGDALPADVFQQLSNQFPSAGELNHYVLARVGVLMQEFVDLRVDAESRRQRSLERRLRKKPRGLLQAVRKLEIEKYRHLQARLLQMLDEDATYPESVWQDEILQIICLISPKYIKAIKGAPVKDRYTGTMRQLDILLVDASGHIDIVETKKPFDQCVVSNGRYRDNHVPMRELSGTVMQIEKYIFYLNKWGTTGEEALAKKHRNLLPSGLELQITNPGGIIILGRDVGLTPTQRRDFEVVRRKYRNVIDIITYDDLLRRLGFIIEQLESVAPARPSTVPAPVVSAATAS